MYYSFGDKTNSGGILLEKSGCNKIIFYLLIQEIKISMTCVYKQYEVKTKRAGAFTPGNNEVFIGL